MNEPTWIEHPDVVKYAFIGLVYVAAWLWRQDALKSTQLQATINQQHLETIKSLHEEMQIVYKRLNTMEVALAKLLGAHEHYVQMHQRNEDGV